MDPGALDPGPLPGSADDGGAPTPLPVTTPVCSDLFDDDVITTYEVEIDPAEWALIHDEFVNWQMREAAGLELNPYHPMMLRHDGQLVAAWIRLKGNSSWFEAVALDPNVKKQFVIAFDQGADPRARFHDVQKVELSMPSLDPTYLRERLAQSFLRDAGLPGLCANSATLVVNGAYYGLYANLEYVNKDFLRRVFPGDHTGDLWDKVDDLLTNEDEPGRDDSRHRALWRATSIGELERLMDMPASLRTWAAEALMAQSDGYWGAFSNFYTYDHPRRGFVWLTDDVDGSFDFMPADMHPLYFWLNRDYPRKPGPQYVMVLASDMWRDSFVAILAELVDRWDVATLQARVDRWAAQIAAAVESDPHKPQTFARHQEYQRRLRDFLPARKQALQRWLDCYRNGGGDTDGDGSPWCRDCDDSSTAAYPGAPEICGDAVDQNCNGLLTDC
jgi:hypothetical protein